MTRKDTGLPFGDAFSPNQLETTEDEPETLVLVLEKAKEFEGDADGFDEWVAERFNMEPYRAKNVRLGISDAGYRIMNDSTDFRFTELGDELYELRGDRVALYDRFAQHILNNLHGQKAINVISDLRAEGKSRKFDNIREELEDRYSLHIDPTSNHWSQMRAWLHEADVIQNLRQPTYDINWSKIEELTGVTEELVLELSDLTAEQRAFLRAMARIDPEDEMAGTKVREIAEQEHDVSIDQNSIVSDILDPLEEEGYLEHEKPTKGKPRVVSPTEKFKRDVLEPVLEDLESYVGAPRAVLRSSFTELLDDLDEGSTHEQGVALEALAIKVGRLLGLDYTAWRKRGRNTGGNEVDVVMDSIDITFQRWQIQCKNTKRKLSIDDVTREVGLSRRLNTDVIVMIGRNGLTSGAQRFADLSMADENLVIVFLEDADIMQLDESPEHLLDKLRAEARRASSFKRLGEGEMVEISEQMIEEEQKQLEEEYEVETEDILDQEQPDIQDYADGEED